jgi:hypothetical protein
VEPYNVYNEYIVNPCIGVSIIPDSTNIDVQDQIMPTHEFHSLLQKMNNQQHLYLMMSWTKKKKQNPIEPIHLFIIGGADKTFILMFLIQALIRFYNRHPHSSPLKKKILLMAYTGKVAFNIDGTIIH